MLKRILFTVFILYFALPKVIAAVDIVYPEKSNLTINSNETFFTGNVDDSQPVTINKIPVKLYENKYFIHMVPLEYGENKIVIKSGADEKIYKIYRKKSSEIQPQVQTQTQNMKKDIIPNIIYSAKTNNNRSTLREKPSAYANRIIELKEGVILNLDSIQNDYYHLAIKGNDYWIHKSNLDDIKEVNDVNYAHLKKHKHYEDEHYCYDKFYLSHVVPYSLLQENNQIKLTIYNVSNGNTSLNTYEYTVTPQKILGYDCIVYNNSIILRYAKIPKIKDKMLPLKGINIFVDAGHGGIEKGTISPERIFEKEMTLDIANTLIKVLKAGGANVSYSRLDDTQVDLYKRVDLAQENDALISVSIHVNSLPYGKNPYVKHGTEVHYYNENAKNLAQIVHNNLANDLNLKPNGIHKSSFALTRNTNPVSILVETAYMQNPDEYRFLKNPVNRRNIAKSIKNSLEEYILSVSECN